MTNWVIFYDDGSSFSSDDGGPGDAPRDGVQVVSIANDRVGRVHWHQRDYYCWHDNEWISRDIHGVMDYLRQPGIEKIVLQGRAIAYRRFVAVLELARYDTRLPMKQGRLQDEPDWPVL